MLFWHDLWNEKISKDTYPRLYTFAKDKNKTATQIILQTNLAENFHLPMSERAYAEFVERHTEIQELQISLDHSQEEDSWTYI
jgi:hypothetical protein